MISKISLANFFAKASFINAPMAGSSVPHMKI